jgi:hypothetical protein
LEAKKERERNRYREKEKEAGEEKCVGRGERQMSERWERGKIRVKTNKNFIFWKHCLRKCTYKIL